MPPFTQKSNNTSITTIRQKNDLSRYFFNEIQENANIQFEC
jgi:hypothetical protein